MLYFVLLYSVFFFFKQKTAYEMRISDWSSDVCSSDLVAVPGDVPIVEHMAQSRHRPIQESLFVGRQHRRFYFRERLPVGTPRKQLGIPPDVSRFNGLLFRR